MSVNMTERITIDEVLKSKVCKTTRVSASYKQVVSTGAYETVTYQQDIEIELDRELSGIEHTIVLAYLNAYLEYNCTVKMLVDEHITRDEYQSHIDKLERYINSLLKKADKLGIGTDYIVSLVADGEI